MEKSKKSKRKVVKILIISLISILFVMLMLVGVLALYINNKLNKINYIEIDVGNIEINEGVEERLAGYRNVVILGIDNFSDANELNGNSDCIIIATLDESAKEVKLTSIYRDTYLEIPGKGLDNINHAYPYAGPALTLSTINTNLDLNITEFVVISFESVINAIDALGGIEIEITSEEIQYLNAYIKQISKKMKIEAQLIKKAGNHKLDGVQALAYSRIRYTAGADYKRTERQRTVIIKMFEKAKEMPKMQLLKAMDEILPIISTNIKKDEIIPAVLQLSKYKVKENGGWPYNVREYIDGKWHGVPVTLEKDVIRLHKEIFGEEDYIPTQKVQEISRKIVERTGYEI